MTLDENKLLVRRYLAALSGREKPASVVDRFVADAKLRRHIAAMEIAFPLYRIDAEDLIAENDRVVVRTTLRGTHQGDFMSTPPTGREVAVPMVAVFRVAGGKIVDSWFSADTLGLLYQIGVLSAPVDALPCPNP
jgi:predicted ester cyclase